MRKMARLVAGASVLLAASAPVAHAAEQVVRGRLFLVTGPSAGMSPSKRHVLIYGTDFPHGLGRDGAHRAAPRRRADRGRAGLLFSGRGPRVAQISRSPARD